MSIIIDEYGFAWKKIENFDETIGRCVACVRKNDFEKDSYLNGWPTYHKKYKYQDTVTSILIRNSYCIFLADKSILCSFETNSFDVYIKMSITSYDPNQEPEDDCL